MSKEIEYRGIKIRKGDKGVYEAYTLPLINGTAPYPQAKTLHVVKSWVDRELAKRGNVE